MSAPAWRMSRSRSRARGDEWLAAAALAALAALVLLVGLLYLRQASAVATGGYDLLGLEAERSRWQVANEQLEYRVAELSALERVEREARDALKMSPPRETVYLRASRH